MVAVDVSLASSPESRHLRGVAHATGAQLDLLRNPLRARQRMTACKTTATTDALGPQFITAVANDAPGPIWTDGRAAASSGRVGPWPAGHGRPAVSRSRVPNASITIKTSSITSAEAKSTVRGRARVDAPTLHQLGCKRRCIGAEPAGSRRHLQIANC